MASLQCGYALYYRYIQKVIIKSCGSRIATVPNENKLKNNMDSDIKNR